MEKKPKLKTKLNFHFNTEDMEVPLLDFLVGDPIEKNKEIKVFKKSKKKKYGFKRKSNTLLF